MQSNAKLYGKDDKMLLPITPATDIHQGFW